MITNGSLTVDIRDDNGAIGAAVFDGVDYFNHFWVVSDFGFQVGTDTSTFRLNPSDPGVPSAPEQPVSVAGTTVTGTYDAGGADVEFERVYELVGGLNVLRITTTFVNNGSDLQLSYFDTLEPDQGVDLAAEPATYNDVFGLAGGTVAQARIDDGGNQHTLIAGSLDPRVTVAAGNLLRIDDGSLLNGFFDSPFDGEDTYFDRGCTSACGHSSEPVSRLRSPTTLSSASRPPTRRMRLRQRIRYRRPPFPNPHHWR